MIRIAITEAAFDAVAATLPLCSVGHEDKRTQMGEVLIWLERHALDRLDALRQLGEGYCVIILRIAEIEASRPGRRRGPKKARSFTARIAARGGRSVPAP
jgi:hypothetical protein